jgi:hypothetical protein
MTVGQRFEALLANLTLTKDQRDAGITNHTGVRSCLNSHYYGISSGYSNSMLVGSWGKSTEVRPPRDIDVLFVLPNTVYWRYQERTGNRQSQLLQEVKSVLASKYSRTNIRGDGPVVLISFSTYDIELVPSFKTQGTQYLIPITNNGGSYKSFDPEAEITKVKNSDSATKGNSRALIRMMKRWQEYCAVPIKSFWLELIAIDFLSWWQYRENGTNFYDWMVRDFFGHLVGKANSYLSVPGTGEIMWIGDAWKSRAESAQGRASKACQYEADNMPYSAGDEWQKIFGDFIPKG